MKHLSTLFVFLLTLALSSCFSKSENIEPIETLDQNTAIEIEKTQELDSDDLNGNQDETGEDSVVSSDGGVSETQDSSQSDTTSQQSDNQNGTQASASGTIETEEIESYEDDLEALFKDILGEIDDEPASE